MRQVSAVTVGVMAIVLLFGVHRASAGEIWPQLKFDGRHSGNVPERKLTVPLGLVGAVPLTDTVLTSPVVAEGRVYVVDGSGQLWMLTAVGGLATAYLVKKINHNSLMAVTEKRLAKGF